MMRLRRGKLCGFGRGGEGKFADQRATEFEDLLGELAIFARIDDIDSGAEDGDGAAAGLDRSLVGDGIDAAGHAADDDESAVGKVLGETLGHAQAVGGGVASADDGDSDLKQDARIATDVEDEWRIVNFGKVLGVELRAHGDQRDSGGLGQLFQLLIGEAERVPEGDGLGAGGGQTGGFEFGERGAEDVFHLGNALEEAADTSGAKLRSAARARAFRDRARRRRRCFRHG